MIRSTKMHRFFFPLSPRLAGTAGQPLTKRDSVFGKESEMRGFSLSATAGQPPDGLDSMEAPFEEKIRSSNRTQPV
jgi:hypothetical protein